MIRFFEDEEEVSEMFDKHLLKFCVTHDLDITDLIHNVIATLVVVLNEKNVSAKEFNSYFAVKGTKYENNNYAQLIYKLVDPYVYYFNDRKEKLKESNDIISKIEKSHIKKKGT